MYIVARNILREGKLSSDGTSFYLRVHLFSEKLSLQFSFSSRVFLSTLFTCCKIRFSKSIRLFNNWLSNNEYNRRQSDFFISHVYLFSFLQTFQKIFFARWFRNERYSSFVRHSTAKWKRDEMIDTNDLHKKENLWNTCVSSEPWQQSDEHWITRRWIRIY